MTIIFLYIADLISIALVLFVRNADYRDQLAFDYFLNFFLLSKEYMERLEDVRTDICEIWPFLLLWSDKSLIMLSLVVVFILLNFFWLLSKGVHFYYGVYRHEKKLKHKKTPVILRILFTFCSFVWNSPIVWRPVFYIGFIIMRAVVRLVRNMYPISQSEICEQVIIDNFLNYLRYRAGYKPDPTAFIRNFISNIVDYLYKDPSLIISGLGYVFLIKLALVEVIYEAIWAYAVFNSELRRFRLSEEYMGPKEEFLDFLFEKLPLFSHFSDKTILCIFIVLVFVIICFSLDLVNTIYFYYDTSKYLKKTIKDYYTVILALGLLVYILKKKKKKKK